jgi:hypothetical protein
MDMTYYRGNYFYLQKIQTLKNQKLTEFEENLSLKVLLSYKGGYNQ